MISYLLKNSRGSVLYIDTERSFSSRRMKQILDSNGLPQNLLDRIIVKSVWDSIPFMDLLHHQIVSSKMNLDLIIIDSIAAPFRSEFETFDVDKRRERVKQIHKLGIILHKLSRFLDIPIIVTNQVTAVMDQLHENFGRPVLPCFGLNWASYVHTRLFLSRTDLILKNNSKVEQRLRKAEVDFSPVIPNNIVHFIVDDRGIHGVDIK